MSAPPRRAPAADPTTEAPLGWRRDRAVAGRPVPWHAPARGAATLPDGLKASRCRDRAIAARERRDAAGQPWLAADGKHRTRGEGRVPPPYRSRQAGWLTAPLPWAAPPCWS